MQGATLQKKTMLGILQKNKAGFALQKKKAGRRPCYEFALEALLGSETSEVVEADLAPLLGVFELMLQAGINLLPALFIDLGLGFVPDADEVFYLLDTTIVVILHLFEYSTSALHAISPGYAMEPQQITLRTGIDVVVERAIGLWIL